MAYESLDLEGFIRQLLPAYPDIVSALELITDGMSPEWNAFHSKSTAYHTGLMWIRHNGITYQVCRVTNLRKLPGYKQYTWEVFRKEDIEDNTPNVAFRFFRDGWEAWKTINLDA